jgi:hypothetical protein
MVSKFKKKETKIQYFAFFSLKFGKIVKYFFLQKKVSKHTKMASISAMSFPCILQKLNLEISFVGTFSLSCTLGINRIFFLVSKSLRSKPLGNCFLL